MTPIRNRASGRRLRAAFAIGIALANGLAGLAEPFVPGVAAADDGLRVRTATTYDVRPDDGRIRVTVDVTATNQVPDRISGAVRTRTFFDALPLAVQPEATRASATSAGRSLRTTRRDRRNHDLVEVRLPRPLFSGETARFRLRYDLPSGAPRSSSDVRVGVAFVTFVARAFGDSGQVTIELPAGFEPSTSGSSLARADAPDGTVLTSGTVTDPTGWYAVVAATRDAALTSEPLALAEGTAVIRGWPEDPDWVRHVDATLTAGLPVLHELIGLPWPVDGSLDIVEAHHSLLEGYGGFYDESSDTITVSEDLDRRLILHETSHAWFNRRLFDERWIVEGLADEYAARALGRLGGTAPPPPAEVRRDDPAAFPLLDWPRPRPIDDDATAAREDYGYDASRTVIGRIVELATAEGMREVLRAAADHEVAYLGDVPPERTEVVPDWSRLLDLVEERTDARVADLFERWVLDPVRAAQLPARDRARAAYHALVDEGAGWLPPLAVRGPMARWRFPEALTEIAAAREILAMRAEIDRRAADLEVTVPAGLEAAFEGATRAVAEAIPVARGRLDALAELEAAQESVDRPRDPVTTIGLIDAPDPADELAAAKTAFTGGDLAGAIARSDAIEATLAQAPEIGRSRLLAGGAIALLVLALLLAIVLPSVRRRRRGPSAAEPAVALATLPATSPGADRAAGPDSAAGQGGDEAR